MSFFSYEGSTTVNFIVSLLFVLYGDATASGITDSLFKVTKGFKLSQGTLLKNVYFKTNSATLCSIMCSSECGSATYSPRYKTCITFLERFYHSNIAWSKDTDWLVLYRNEPIQHDGWTMVFRAQKEINIPLYDVWNATGQQDDSPLSSGVLNGCYRLDNLGSCKQHFRSSILDNWSNIKHVKFSVYVNGSEVNYIVFDGTATTRDSWFKRPSIQASSWFGIAVNFGIWDFDIIGYTDNGNRRRFVICGVYFGCLSDTTYFLAVDQRWDACEKDWSINITNYPVFIYSPLLTMTLPSTKVYRLADVIAVFVEF